MNNNSSYPPPPPSSSAHVSRHTTGQSVSMNSQNMRTHTLDNNSIVNSSMVTSGKTYISNVSIYDRNLRLTKDTSSSGGGYSSSKKNDLNREKEKEKVSLSIFALLFSEIIQYYQNRVYNITDLERKLEELGYSIGYRILEIVSIRERTYRREVKVVNFLTFISTTIWKYLFNKDADALESSFDKEDEYMIRENKPLTNTFISVPSDMGSLNCASYVAGIIAGILDSANFNATVTAHSDDQGEEMDGMENTYEGVTAEKDVNQGKTVFLIKFSREVMHREKTMGT